MAGEDKGGKCDRTVENVQKSLHRMMKRLNRIKKTYNVDFYFFAKYRRFFKYTISPDFRPIACEIVSSIAPLKTPY